MNTTVLIILLPIFVISQIACIVLYMKTRHLYDDMKCFEKKSAGGNYNTYEEARQISFQALKEYGELREGSLPEQIKQNISEQSASVLLKYSQLTFDGTTFVIDVPSDFEKIQFSFNGEPKLLQIGHWSTGDEMFIALDPDDLHVYVKEKENLYHPLSCCIFHYIDYAKDLSG